MDSNIIKFINNYKYLLTDWTILLALLITFITSLIVYQEINHRIIKKKLNLDGPWPWPVFGNLYSIFFTPDFVLFREWGNNYGRIYVFFAPSKPTVSIEDAEVIRDICIRDFDIFPNHNYDENLKKSKLDESLLSLRDDEWRKTRVFMSTTFTSNKIKRMYELMNQCCDDLIDYIDEQIQNKDNKSNDEATNWSLFKSKDTYRFYALNTISTCCYAMKIERTKGEANFETTASRNKVAKIIDDALKPNFNFIWYIILPRFIVNNFLPKISTEIAQEILCDHIAPLLEARKKKRGYYNDYLQLLVDARLDDELDLTKMDNLENHHAGLTSESLDEDQKKMKQAAKSSSTSKGMSDKRMLANALLLLLGGTETTSTLLKNITYCLAHHPLVQHKLYEEIKRKIPVSIREGGKNYLEYEKVTACEYLDSVICEVLRILLPFSHIFRENNEQYFIEKYNVLLPKHTRVDIQIYRVHMNPEYWTEPEKFEPERFMPENRHKIVPGSYLPFGLGPRHCVGMRFGLTETKLALAKIMLGYEFKPIKQSPWPPVPVKGIGTVAFHPSDVLIRPRTLN